ncbi:Hint domain-containing protein [Acetobacter cerevisiae]|uniref:Hint domain-containing protein n=1 Tax=Acetobacter cerevisiae TaxID=178900 RepID=A0ABT1EV55_9PROT|nr:Hint domain-containing protein [Acetobacter cerevisiae]MCP1247266.1 Hint domain-containing protein [Acetobacter cerevisiae]MCP1256813.1 Hint domain-containing protein [Acetobacter cerevisiae]
MTSTSTVNTLSGPYTLNFAYMDRYGNLSNITRSATVTFNPNAKTLTVNGTTYKYDFSWGKDGSNILVLGSGGVNGGYYAISDADVDFSKYTYTNHSYGSNNNWTVTSPQGTATALPFDGSGNSGFDPCFLAGTEISVCGSLQKVEDLAVGGQIDIFVDGTAKQQTISWVGKSVRTVNSSFPDDEAGYPVRILKDAISDGVPFKDMLITAEHCLFFDGKFIPARMLVNGRSIFFDKSITSYDYYHVETEEHSVIMADGMLTESYLDTGNRHSFSQKGKVTSISSRNLTWKAAAAPLMVSRETIEPLFRQIEARAERAGYAVQTESRPLTNDSDLHLKTNAGAIIRPIRQNNGRVMFMIPSDIQSVRIVSNASRPCDVIGPFIDDRRSLGVLVGTVTLFESNKTLTLTNHLHDAQLSGWNNVEEGTMRWTSGNALLPLGERAPGALALMAIEVKAAGPYILDETLSENHALKA